MTAIPICISLQKDLLTEIDTERGDIPRSKFILRMIERDLKKRGPRSE